MVKGVERGGEWGEQSKVDALQFEACSQEKKRKKHICGLCVLIT
jgi:hypothetical protein